jgi:hypothetical protein
MLMHGGPVVVLVLDLRSADVVSPMSANDVLAERSDVGCASRRRPGDPHTA